MYVYVWVQHTALRYVASLYFKENVLMPEFSHTNLQV